MNPYVPSDPSPRAVGPARRDRSRLAIAAVAGVATAGSLVATGWLAGQAAGEWSAQHPSTPTTTTPADQAMSAATTATTTTSTTTTTRAHAGRDDGERERKPRVVLRDRPTRTRVTTRYVTSPAPVGGGGSVGSTSSQPVHHSSPAPSSGS